MKNSLLILLACIILAIAIPTMAQPPTVPCNPTSRPKVPVQTFPIGGFDYGLDLSKIDLNSPQNPHPNSGTNILTEMINGGMNILWFQGGGSVAQLAANTPPQMGIDYGEHGSILEYNYFSALNTRLCASERRYFLASNEMNLVSQNTPLNPPPAIPNATTQSSDLSVLDLDRLHYCRGEDIVVRASGAVEYVNASLSTAPPYEFHVKKNLSSGTSILVLDRNENFQQDYNVGWTDNSATPVTFQYGNLICDFIYRLSASDASLGSGALYYIDYSVSNGATVLSHTSLTASPLSIPITNSLYNSDPIPQIGDVPTVPSNQYLADVYERQPNILTFPKGTSNRYAILRIVIPINNSNGGLWPTEIKFTLSSNNSNADIFVRGFRLRTQLMNELENGYKDADLANIFKSILSEIYTYGGCDGLNNTSYLTAGGEIGSADAFRSLAYVDNFLANYTSGGYKSPLGGTLYRYARPCFSYQPRQMHIYTFLADGSAQEHFDFPSSDKSGSVTALAAASNGGGALYSYYRSVYEDETGKLPPPSMEEGLNFTYSDAWGNGSANNGIPIPRDGIPYALLEKKGNGFVDFQMPITGYIDPENAISASSRIWTHLNSDPQSTPKFDTYLLKMQSVITDWNNTEFYASSAAANPPYYQLGMTPRNELGSWWGIVPAIMTFDAPQIQPGTSFWLQPDIVNTVIKNRQQSTLQTWGGTSRLGRRPLHHTIRL